MNYIGLLDCNNFFVSCERLFRPDLVGKPVAVLSGNDGCVVARSNEVKELGIPMGIPVFQVKKELEAAQVTLFSSNFTLYRDISSRVMQVLQEEIGQVEQYSVDEAFFGSTAADEAAALTRITALKQTVETKVGVPVSIGLARTKTIAKYAAEKEKRGSGVCIMVGDVWQQERTALQLSQVWGIGSKTSQKFRAEGLETVADLIAADPTRVASLFGVSGVRVRDELREKPVYRLGEQKTEQQSIMSTRSFKDASTDSAVVEDALAHHVTQAAAELRQLGMVAGAIHVIARPSRHGQWVLHGGSKEQIFETATSDTRTLIAAAKQVFQSIHEAEVPYKRVGIVLQRLRTADMQQGSLFVKDTTESAAVMEVLDGLNQQFGTDTITVGNNGLRSSWEGKRDQLSPRYTTKWSEISLVTIR